MSPLLRKSSLRPAGTVVHRSLFFGVTAIAVLLAGCGSEREPAPWVLWTVLSYTAAGTSEETRIEPFAGKDACEAKLRATIASYQALAARPGAKFVVEGARIRWNDVTPRYDMSHEVTYECRSAGPEGTSWTLWKWEESTRWSEIEAGFAGKAKCDAAGQKRQADSRQLVWSCWPSGTKPPGR